MERAIQVLVALIVVTLLSKVAVAHKPNKAVTLVTVCDVLKSPQQFRDKIWQSLADIQILTRELGWMKRIVDLSS